MQNIARFVILIGCLCPLSLAFAHNYVEMNSEYSYHMMDPTTDFAHKQRFLFNNKAYLLTNKKLTIGGTFTGLVDYQKSNRESKFGYMMRHPGSTNQIGKEASELVVHSAQIQASGRLNTWIAFYNELLYNPQQSFASGNITNLSRNQVQIRRAYVMFGDKEYTPFYLTLGKQDVPFGHMDTLSPFTISSTPHTFVPLAYSAVLGLDWEGLNIEASAIQGGSQFRAASVPIKGTSTPSRVTNYAVTANYTLCFLEHSKLIFGGGFIKGSTFNQEFPIMHHVVGKKENPAWTAFTRIDLDNFTLLAEFASTTRNMPGTFNPSTPLNVFPASKVSSFGIGGRYTFRNLLYQKDVRLSLEHSEIKTGPSGSPWEKQQQLVGGIAVMIDKNIKLFGEVVRVKGYTPFHLLTGDSQGPGTTDSDQGARETVFVLGIQASL